MNAVGRDHSVAKKIDLQGLVAFFRLRSRRNFEKHVNPTAIPTSGTSYLPLSFASVPI
jgi:hypothetical protein